MTERLEWDFPPTKRYRHRPHVEIMEPQQPRYDDVRVTYHRHNAGSRGLQHWLIVAAVLLVGLFLLRSPMVLLLGAALVGWQTIAMFAFVVVVLMLVALREHRRGRPF